MQAVFPPWSRARERRRIPQVSGALPVVGHALEFGTGALDLLQRAHRECGELAGLRLAHRRAVLMTGPEAAEAFYRAPDEQLSPNEAYKMMVPVFGEDVVYDCEPKRMGEQLSMVRPALQDQRMRTYGEIIGYEVRRAVEPWGDEGEIDLVDFCAALTNATSTHCLIGREFREDMGEEFARVYMDLEHGISPLSYIQPYLPLPQFIRRDRARRRLTEMIGALVAQRRAQGTTGEDFLQTLMEARYSTGEGLSDHEITGMLLASMFAGHHTSAVTTAWSLLELARHPDYLDRTCAELHAAYRPGDEVDYLSLREIPLTEQAVKEALRLHPPLFVLMRAVLRDFHFRDFCIPAGHWVMSSPYVSHRLPEVFADPERWDPDRFGPGREEGGRNFTFLAFGGGRHTCMGNAFAMLQVKTILAVLLRAFEFELLGDPVREHLGVIVLGPRQPCRVRYRRIAPRGAI